MFSRVWISLKVLISLMFVTQICLDTGRSQMEQMCLHGERRGNYREIKILVERCNEATRLDHSEGRKKGLL